MRRICLSSDRGIGLRPPAGSCAGSLSIRLATARPSCCIWPICSWKSFEVEALPALILLRELLRAFDDRRSSLTSSTSARTSPMPRMRLAMRSGWNASSAVELLADADELDRLAGDVPHRQRRAAARIAVELGQDDARERQRVAEGARGVDRVLTGHGVDDEQRFDRLDSALMQRADLAASSLRRCPGGRPCRRSARRKMACCVLRARARSDVRRLARSARTERSRRRACAATRCSCSIAAGRYTSVETSSTFFVALLRAASARACRRWSSCRRPAGRPAG